MKKNYFLVLLLLNINCYTEIFAQTPETFSYQAVIRDSSSQLVANQDVGVLIEIIEESVNGEPVYSEMHSTLTNQNGLISLQIGGGIPNLGIFSEIDWSAGPYFLKTQTDPAGGTNYNLVGITQLLSVPYAMHAKSTDTWKVSGDTVSTFSQVVLGSSSINQSAILELHSQNKGFLPPRMNNSERDAIENPTDGMVIYNTKTKCLNFFNFDRWFEVCGNLIVGKISSLDCSAAIISEPIPFGFNISANSIVEIPYTGGNGGSYNLGSVSSTGVTGLTASVEGDTLVLGDGFVNIAVSGVSESEGLAGFEISLGGQSCFLELPVEQFIPSPPTYCTGSSTEIVDLLNPITGRTWMDRNLGASRAAISSDDSLAFGDLYQWGRRSDGHQCRNSETTSVLSSTDIPNHGDFILSLEDWREPPNNDLWQDGDTVNNPCPTGYRLPTLPEMNAEISSWNELNILGAYNSPLKWTTGSYRDFAGSIAESQAGYYWSSRATNGYSRALRFTINSAQMDPRKRANGKSVRCIKD
jgi:hypothetical protein